MMRPSARGIDRVALRAHPTCRTPLQASRRTTRWTPRSAAGTLVLIMLATWPAASAGQSPDAATPDRSLPWRFELGATASTAIVEDGNGVTVRRGLGPIASVERTLIAGRSASVVVAARAAVGPLRLESAGAGWSAGTMRQFDLAVRAERRLPGAIVLGAGLALVRGVGPADVIPFRARRGSIRSWGPELVAARRIADVPRLEAVLAGDLLRLGGQRGEAPPVEGGWIGRVRIGIRHAR